MSTFEKIEDTDRCIYGPRGLLLCGFSSQAQSKFHALLKMLEIGNLPLVWVTDDRSDAPLEELLQLPDGTGAQQDSGLDRAIVVAGIAEKELHRLMSGCRQAGMQDALWAALTPTSEKWTMAGLIAELKAEREAMAKRRRTT
jgi:hypothetical protein